MRALNVLLAILVSLAIALGVLEFGFRLIPAFAPPATLNHFDTTLGWSKEPEKSITRRVDHEKIHFEINEHGLRDDPGVGPGKEPNTFRVLMLGDSFVLGFTVERKDLFVDELEGWWKSEDRRIDVVNAGTEGWSTDQEVAWFLQNAKAYDPDLVLLFPYENDLYWNGQESYYGNPKPRFEPSGVFEAKTLTKPVKKKKLRESSAMLRALGMLAAGTPPPNPEFGVLLDAPPAGYADWVARTENALENLREACTVLGARLVMVPIPSKSAVDPAEKAFFQNWKMGLRGEPVAWSPDKPVNEFLGLATKLGIEALDPRATLIAETKAKGKLYFEEDVEWHFNALGNEVFATWLHGELDRRGVFPPEHAARASGALPEHGHAQGGLPTWLYVFAGLWLFLGTAFCMTYPDEPKPRAYLGVGAMLGSVFLIVIGGGKLMGAELIAPWRTWIFVGLVAVILGFLAYKLGRRLGTVLELLAAFTRRGHWYLMPLVVVLLTIGSLLVVAASSPLIAPFIYTLF